MLLPEISKATAGLGLVNPSFFSIQTWNLSSQRWAVAPYPLNGHSKTMLVIPHVCANSSCCQHVQEAHQPVDGPLRAVTVIEMQQIPDETLWS